MLTRRSFLANGLGSGLILTAPGIVSASSLDYVPKQRYEVYTTEDFDTAFIKDSNGNLAGWFHKTQLDIGLGTKKEVLKAATTGFDPVFTAGFMERYLVSISLRPGNPMSIEDFISRTKHLGV